ncbi:MAG TPA: non-ribosomal peptide synthase/polyketide synthase, partial [Thermoanaerobaculia bacterium]|nr:non-ribosomal peptide synthase/polyketide synthase [Thermoanaerobaculia bacterium]
LYRTGDLVRRLPDGDIDFLGRRDHQVKVRGFRIETGEIEVALASYPGVRECAVLVQEGTSGDRRLVAYIAAEPGAVSGPQALRDFLKDRLPDYMIPSGLVILESLPLTPNGKVDRRALAEEAPEMERLDGDFVPPSGPTAELLAGIWSEVLGVERIGAEDSFFELGGHSLLATQVVSRACEAFGVELPLRKLFEAPTLAGFADTVDTVRQAARGLEAPPLLPVPRDSAGGDLPLSFAQQRLWFLDQLGPGSAAYNVPLAVWLDGVLDLPLLRRVLDELVRRHESLRTTFTASAGRPVQAIAPELRLPLPVVDLAALSPVRRQAAVRGLAEGEARRPFDLEAGPLVRTTLIRLGEDEHAALVTMHHIVSDAWSMGVFLRELAAVYEAFAAGRPSPLAALRVQYADFAAWQRGWLQGEVLEGQLSYWRGHLAGAPALLELPADRPRPAVQTLRGASLAVALPRELAESLAELGRKAGATSFMTLLAAFQTLLGRLSGQDDVLAGSPIAGRNRRETEELIGFFVNTLVLRADLSGDPRFRDLLARVRTAALDAYAYQDVPFERLVEELAPERSMAHSPLFQVMFALQNAPPTSLELPGLRLSPLETEGRTAKFDLTLTLQEGRDGISGALDYNTDLFDRATVTRWLASFQGLLEQLAAAPESRLSELRLLSSPERHQLLLEWNDTGGPVPPLWLHTGVAEQAARTPDTVAVVFEERALTYGELERSSNRLARRLRAAGLGPESRVGICLERSLDLPVALLAALKAGGAYLPIDPALPAERLAMLFEDAGAALVVTESRLRPALAAAAGRLLLLDAERERLAAEDGGPLDTRVEAGHLAYVLFTSGSTGRPKGVMIPHGAIANHMRWMLSALPLGADGAVLQKTPFNFDASVWEFWAPLMSGARLVMARPGGHKDPAYLVETLRREGITTLQVVPQLLRMLVEEPGFEECRALRRLFVGGEALVQDLARRTAGRSPAGLYNLYGPTETSIDTTVEPVDWRRAAPGGGIPLGWPIFGVRVHVVDSRLQPAPIGVAGELWVGGAGLGRGYLGRPDLTANRFVPDPWSERPGDRLYRSGDLVRRLPDGNLDYLGRTDHQVKLRGFRVELGDIESVLASCPGVREVAVLVREDTPGNRQLAAYIGRDPGDSTDLRGFLQARLPEYMAPSVYVVMERLPLNPSGKIDRQALARIVPERTQGGGAPAALGGPTEELLAGIWSEVLGVEQVGPEDSFFDLGGHSLLATQVASRVREAFGVDLPLRVLFEEPTLARLAAAVDAARLAERGFQAPPVVPVPRDADLPLSFAQQRLWFLDQLGPGSSAYNLPLAVRLDGALDLPLLRRVLDELVRRHESLRTTFAVQDGSPVQVIAPELRLPAPVIDLSALPQPAREAELRELAAEEARRPFDLQAGPLVRTTLVRLEETGHAALVTMHHIVSDAWSMGVFLRELAALYEALAARRSSPLPDLPVQYADFAVWQRRWLTGAVLESQLAYWRRQLAGLPPALELPTDRPRTAVRTFRGAARPVAFSAGLVADLAALCRREGATLYMVLLAAFQSLLARYSGQDDLTMGSPIAGRNRRELEGLIGFFINTLVLRADLADGSGFRRQLAAARRTALDAYAHQDVPFERLVEELAPERSLDRSPLFQVLFTLQNAPRAAFELPGLTLAPLALEAGTAKFDLSLSLTEAGGGVAGILTYSTDLFDATTIDRMLRHLERLLRAAAEDPELSLAALPLFDDAERHQLLVEWNDSALDVPAATVADLFAAQARRTPDAPAVSSADGRIRYAELARRAGRLARRLRALGVGPESRVGLCVERSAEAVVGVLGILQAGGVYVPLDPALPAERRAWMVEDSGAVLVLTREMLSAEEDGPYGAEAALLPENAAYVIYTSGSTGRPKGTVVSHRSLSNYLAWVEEGLDLAGRPLPLITSLGFDASLKQLLSPLLRGDEVWVLPPDVQPAELLAALADRPGAALNCVPALWRAVLDLVEADRPLDLGCLLLGGETLAPALVERTYAALPGVRIVNLYGPTEATANASADRVRAGEVPGIGRPTANAGLYVLGPDWTPVPIGARGELAIGGAGVARGYLGRPELTAERFLPDPFGPPGTRLYCSGDLARFRAGGDLEFLGRTDDQVKIRGFRVEPGEVEAALARCPGVAAAAVVVQGAGERRLMAYVVGTGDARGLRTALKAELPEYMVPAAFVFLDALPLTATGKVDRRELARRAPEAAAGSGEGFDGPIDPVTALLAGIWAEVLGVGRVGIGDDFFELGGHSLLATQVVSRVRDAFGVELPLRRLFEAPTVAGLAAAVRQAQGGFEAPPVTPVPRDGNLPLSFAQERLWFIDQLQPGSAAYNMPAAVRLSGALDVAWLHRVLRELARRHESLRTTFTSPAGRPVQVIAAEPALPLPVLDLSGLPAVLREKEARRQAADEARTPFDLTVGPLLRARLLRLAPDEHVALLTLHHAVSDGWSVGIFLRELAALYARAPLPDLPVQYADFAAWQRRWLEGGVLEAQLAYWRRQLAGLPPSLDLPADRPRPAVQTFRGAARAVALPRSLSAAVLDLSRRQGATPFMTLLAAFQVLLGRYAGRDDVAVGSPIAGRNRREIEGLIGFFVNTLVLRADLGGDPPFQRLLAGVRATALDAYAHQDVPFERLVEELAPGRSLARSPLFQVVFALQNAPRGAFELPGLTLSPVAQTLDTAKFELTLNLREDAGEIAGGIEYNTDLFDATTVARLLGHFATLLARIVADPERRLSDLPLLDEPERRQLLVEWNDTRLPLPARGCVHEMVAERARTAPDAVALACGPRVLTYGALNARANRLAHRLRSLGVGPESVVGVWLDRSPEEVAALLAVLKAGAAYLPLDPSYPVERLAFTLQDAGASVLLTTAARAGELPVRTVVVEDLDGDDTDSNVEVDPGHLAYVIYTSGSTGRPKGVAVEHRGLLNLLGWHQAAFGVSPDDRATRLSGLGFDASVWDLWPYLAAGASVHIPNDENDEEVRISPPALRHWLLAEQVTCTFVPTPVAEGLLALAWPAAVPLRLLLTGGDRLHRHPVAPLPFTLVNDYGPTENTVVATSGAVPVLATDRAPSIGRPIANVRVHLLDAGLGLVPAGVPGELCIAGASLARGYLGRPELTAERFFPDPFATGPGGRMYRTGDLARRLPEGEIEFLGRIDHQVKVRGFRIELGEIEAALRAQPGVEECAVLVREERLVAYLAAETPVPELTAALRRTLPDYMVPSAFVVLDALPLTPNGKVDRQALARIAPVRSGSDGVVTTPTGELLAGIWAEVLGLDRVGPQDDFFALGGHSLLATQVVSRVREAFGVDLPLRRLFEAPALSALAEAVDAARQAERGLDLPPVVPVPRDLSAGDLPLSFAQQRLWFLDQLDPGSPAYNVPAALRLSGDLVPGVLQAALDGLARRHETLRTTFAADSGTPRQVIAEEARLACPVVDLAALAEEVRERETRRLAMAEARRPFDLAVGPLARVSLLRLEEGEHVLLLTLHHIVSDGWSMGIFLRELAALYQGSPLPALPVQYADFAAWQRRWLEGPVLEAQVDYWRRQLTGAPPSLELPTDRPRPAVQTFRGSSRAFALGTGLSAALAGLVRREGVTPFMALLAAFGTLLGRWSGQEDVVVGSPIAGRNRKEIEGLIGFFVNTLALRADIGGDPGFRQLLGRVRQTSLDAYAHQDLPFERLVEALHPVRDLSRNPVFQVMFALQNAPGTGSMAPGLALRPLPAGGGSAKFELTLSLQERDDGWAGALEYNTDLFDGTTMTRLLGHFEHLLAAVLEDPERRLSQLPWGSDSERHQLLREWNDTDALPATGTIHGLFEAQAERTPDAPAVVRGYRSLTYAELECAANRLAHRLIALGVGPESRVGVCLERTPEMVAALLGILKAGGAYVPLDPAYPAERLAWMLEDSGATAVVTQPGLLPDVRVPRVGLDEAGPTERPARRAAAGNLAYLIYTSGSTGRPKGVAIEHRSAVAFLEWARGVFPAEELAGVLAATSISFDLSVFELFAPLAWGGTAILVTNALELASLPAGAEIRLVNTVPSALSELLRLDALPASVRTVNLAGEALPGSLADRIHARGTVRRVLNLYGPSEDTTYSTYARAEAAGRQREPAIGRPIAGTRAYVLDRRLEPVPLGAAGELYLGGAGLARGYLGRPDLTAERFVPDPFGTAAGGRLYRTGDLARLRPDGDLDYLGRIDHQVKVRGFRIELGEVEAALARLPGVREAAVVVREDGDKSLVACLVGEVEARELEAALRRTLPEYMVPSAFAVLEALPLSPNGKVDRRALARMDLAMGRPERAVVAPRDPLEAQLAVVWEELLGTGPVGIHDDFFELGGHSLLAVRLVAMVRERLGERLPLTAVFQTPTVERMAALLRRSSAPASRPVLVTLQRGGSLPPLFLVHAIGGNVFSYARLARELGPERPVHGLQSPDPGVPLASLEEMAAYYLEAVRAAAPRGPYRLGGWSMGGVVAFEMARQLAARGEAPERLLLIDAFAPGLGGDFPELDDATLADLFRRDLAGQGMSPEELGEETGRELFALFRRNYRALSGYAPRPYPGDLVLFQAAERDPGERERAARGWRSLAATPEAVDVVEVPGNHFSILAPPQVRLLGERLARRLGRH